MGAAFQGLEIKDVLESMRLDEFKIPKKVRRETETEAKRDDGWEWGGLKLGFQSGSCYCVARSQM